MDRAIQRGAERACREEAVGDGEGLTADVLIEAIDDQVRAVVDGVTPANANNFVDLPDGVRVVNVRRLRTGGTGVEPTVVITNNQE